MELFLYSIILSVLVFPFASSYTLVDNYDASNWYDSFDFQDVSNPTIPFVNHRHNWHSQGPDPTDGFVDYVAVSEAQSLGLAKTIGNQVFLGVDNSSVLSATGEGRKSIWLTSKTPFLHGLLIGDFAHMPGSICGLWPALWVYRSVLFLSEDKGWCRW